MAKETEQSAREAEIRALVEERSKAVRRKDVEGASAHCAPDAIFFDVINPLQRAGSGSARQRAQEWFSSFDGPLGFDVSELQIAAGENVAFCHGLNHVKGKRVGGGEIDMWWRVTTCYRKSGGEWMITHEHGSVPFDVETGKASLGLKP